MKKLKIAVAFILFAALCLGIYVAQNEPNVHIPYIANEIKPESDKLPEQTEQKNETVNESTEPPVKNEVQPKEEVPAKSVPQCTISVRCDTVLNNISKLDKDKVDIMPKNGIILPETTVELNENESVFDVLKRVLREKKIHMEFSKTPGTGSAYIEGIANLYELDCGELSGWMFKVNGEFPKLACSEITLKDGDKVEFIYTCDLGADIGGSDASGGA